MNEWHLFRRCTAIVGRFGIADGWPLAEWLPSVRFISAKGHPPTMPKRFGGAVR